MLSMFLFSLLFMQILSKIEAHTENLTKSCYSCMETLCSDWILFSFQ